MKDKSAQDLVDVMRGLIRDEVSKTSQMILCEVDHVNSDGTADVLIVPDNKTLIKGVPNNTPHSLKSGDSVYLMKINNQIANSFIIRKSAEKSGNSEDTIADISDINDAIKRLENQYQLLSKETLTRASLWKSVYPIGTVYESVDLNFSPTVNFSGSWSSLKNGLYENNNPAEPLPLYEKTGPDVQEGDNIYYDDPQSPKLYALVRDNTISIYTADWGTPDSTFVDIPVSDSTSMSIAGSYLFTITKTNKYSSLGIMGAALIRRTVGIVNNSYVLWDKYPYNTSAFVKINATTTSKQVFDIPAFTKLAVSSTNKSGTFVRIFVDKGVIISSDTPIVLEAHLVRWPRRWYRSS